MSVYMVRSKSILLVKGELFTLGLNTKQASVKGTRYYYSVKTSVVCINKAYLCALPVGRQESQLIPSQIYVATTLSKQVLKGTRNCCEDNCNVKICINKHTRMYIPVGKNHSKSSVKLVLLLKPLLGCITDS